DRRRQEARSEPDIATMRGAKNASRASKLLSVVGTPAKRLHHPSTLRRANESDRPPASTRPPPRQHPLDSREPAQGGSARLRGRCRALPDGVLRLVAGRSICSSGGV